MDNIGIKKITQQTTQLDCSHCFMEVGVAQTEVSGIIRAKAVEITGATERKFTLTKEQVGDLFERLTESYPQKPLLIGQRATYYSAIGLGLGFTACFLWVGATLFRRGLAKVGIAPLSLDQLPRHFWKIAGGILAMTGAGNWLSKNLNKPAAMGDHIASVKRSVEHLMNRSSRQPKRK